MFSLNFKTVILAIKEQQSSKIHNITWHNYVTRTNISLSLKMVLWKLFGSSGLFASLSELDVVIYSNKFPKMFDTFSLSTVKAT